MRTRPALRAAIRPAAMPASMTKWDAEIVVVGPAGIGSPLGLLLTLTKAE